jgi:hypothetical protein
MRQILSLKKREQAESVPQTKTTAMDGSVDKLSRVLRFAKLGKRKRHGRRLRDQIAAEDGQIDKAVYGLGEEEVRVVQGENT